MGLDNIKKRYQGAINNPAEVRGRLIIRTKTERRLTLKELEEAQAQEYRDMGFNLDKLRESGFNPETCNPDDYCSDEYCED